MTQTPEIVVRLNSIEYGAEDINIYSFGRANGSDLPAADPGAHIDIEVQSGVLRQYSLINYGATLQEYKIAVRRDPTGRGGSVALHDSSIVGENFHISTPRNNFRLQETKCKTVLLAGGIGVTPLLGMYKKLLLENANVELHYWAKRSSQHLYRSWLKQQSTAFLYSTEGGRSLIPSVTAILRNAEPDAQFYCCGPTAMLSEFDVATVGMPPEKLHTERFSGNLPIVSEDSFVVHCEKSGVDVEVLPEDSILRACLRAGLDLQYSCEEGTCGACEVEVLEGRVVHNDTVSSPEKHDSQRTMMICCSRAAGPTLKINI